MPHQQLIVDVALEILPDTGMPAYREVIVTMPRQMGKTLLVFSVEMDRCLFWGGRQRVVYTAQTGTDARRKLLEEQEPTLRDSPLWSAVRRVHHAQGNEGILFKNGSRIALAASSPDAGHGFTTHLGIVDECWADVDDRREQAMIPAMNTVADAQLWVTSTQGTEASAYLNRKTEMGRAAAAADKGTGTAYFEWSVPEGADIEDPEVWWAHMPALGWTISPAVIEHALESMEEAEFRRAYCNQRTTSTREERVIPAVLWDAAVGPDVQVRREGGYAWFGVDVSPDRSSAAVAASDGTNCELVAHESGTGWVVERAKTLHERWGGSFVLDGGGPAASLAAPLEAEGLPLVKLGSGDTAAACARLYDAVADGRIKVRRHAALDEAVENLAKRPAGDRFMWDRRLSRADISPLYAMTLAYDQAVVNDGPQDVLLYVSGE